MRSCVKLEINLINKTMTIQNLLDWLQEAEDNNTWQVSTQSVKRHLEKIQQTEQLNLTDVSQQRELLLAYSKSVIRGSAWDVSKNSIILGIDKFLSNL